MAENLVIIPTYNEKENIEKIIRYVFNLPMLFHILVVEDRRYSEKPNEGVPRQAFY